MRARIAAIVSLFTMVFAAVTCLLILARCEREKQR
jgi:hypothetical protein